MHLQNQLENKTVFPYGLIWVQSEMDEALALQYYGAIHHRSKRQREGAV